MLLGLAKSLQNDVPDLPKILITTQKVEVARYLREEQKSCRVALAPADTPWTLRKFLRRTRPVGLILGENELWPGYLSSMQRFTKSPSVALVSGRFQKAIPGMDFSGIGYVAMQTLSDQSRFLKASEKTFRSPICVGGNWKLLSWARGAELPLNQTEAFRNQQKFTSFISLHIEELPFLRNVFEHLVADNKTVVLAPRRLEEVPQISEELRSQNISVIQWPAAAPGAVSIVNCFGKVKEILARSESAFVGGSFHKSQGIHDFWEPLQMGVSTFVGPYCRGAESTVDGLVKQGALVRLKSPRNWSQKPTDKACIVASLAKEREKILNSYGQLKKFVEELLK